MKRVSFEIAKVLKEAGYPQLRADSSYGVIDGELFNIVADDDYFISAPYAMDVWLWIWREKNFYIKLQLIGVKFYWQLLKYKYDKWHSYGIVSATGHQDPEDAIIAAIDYLVENNLIK